LFDFFGFGLFKKFQNFKLNRLIFSEPIKQVRTSFAGFYENQPVLVNIVIHDGEPSWEHMAPKVDVLQHMQRGNNGDKIG
jgi:hypothetical protein